jgi:hypothetical protein
MKVTLLPQLTALAQGGNEEVIAIVGKLQVLETQIDAQINQSINNGRTWLMQ